MSLRAWDLDRCLAWPKESNLNSRLVEISSKRICKVSKSDSVGLIQSFCQKTAMEEIISEN
jgi:hypothetical protein